MTDNSHRTLERIARRVPVPEPAYDRLLRRRDRKARNRRLSAGVLAIVLTLLSITGLMRAFRNSERPATEPTPTPVDRGIFSGLGGWIAYADTNRIWAMDPERQGIRKQLSTDPGEPLAWSSDGSKLSIIRQVLDTSALPNQWHAQLYVLNADGSETLLIDGGANDISSGGSFSPDGSKVVYAEQFKDASGIYVVEAAGGTSRLLFATPRRWYRFCGCWQRQGLWWATFSPDGSQIAYFEGWGDHDNSLWVMNADGSGSRVLLKDAGLMKDSAGLRHLVWSPDGRRLAFGMGYGPYSIYVVGADGSGLTRVIANGVRPNWSPDGSRIAYDQLGANIGGADSLYGIVGSFLAIADADGTHVQRFNDARSGPWNPLDRAESGTQGTSGTRDTSGTAGATRADTLIYAIAALAAVGIVVLWLRRKRKTWAEAKEKIE